MRRRFTLALCLVALVAADASACGPVRGLFHRIRSRIQARRGVAERAPAEQYQPTQFSPASACPDGRCPLQRPTAAPLPSPPPPPASASSVVVFATPRRMP